VDDIRAADKRIRPHAIETPLLPSPAFSSWLSGDASDATLRFAAPTVFLKCDDEQTTVRDSQIVLACSHSFSAGIVQGSRRLEQDQLAQ
jgi:hypothetical protein